MTFTFAVMWLALTCPALLVLLAAVLELVTAKWH